MGSWCSAIELHPHGRLKILRQGGSDEIAAVAATLRAAGCVFAEEEAKLLVSEGKDPERLAAMVERRAAGIPLEHVVGWAEFCGLRVAVEEGVFVPRPRSELLVAESLRLLAGSTGPIVVDLCCGSGAIGAAITAGGTRPIELHAADIDPVAIRSARLNLASAGGTVHEGDLFEPLPGSLRGRVDLIAVNAPYVPTGELDLMPREARLHEPRMALDGGADGADVQRRVAAASRAWIRPGGHLLTETTAEGARPLVECFEEAGLAAQVRRSEELEAAVVIGTAAKPPL